MAYFLFLENLSASSELLEPLINKLRNFSAEMTIKTSNGC